MVMQRYGARLSVQGQGQKKVLNDSKCAVFQSEKYFQPLALGVEKGVGLEKLNPERLKKSVTSA